MEEYVEFNIYFDGIIYNLLYFEFNLSFSSDFFFYIKDHIISITGSDALVCEVFLTDMLGVVLLLAWKLCEWDSIKCGN